MWNRRPLATLSLALQVRAAAASVLARLGEDELAAQQETLKKCLQHPSPQVQAAVIRALRGLHKDDLKKMADEVCAALTLHPT